MFDDILGKEKKVCNGSGKVKASSLNNDSRPMSFKDVWDKNQKSINRVLDLESEDEDEDLQLEGFEV